MAKPAKVYKDPTADKALSNVDKGRESYPAVFAFNGLSVYFTKDQARLLAQHFTAQRKGDQIIGTVNNNIVGEN